MNADLIMMEVIQEYVWPPDASEIVEKIILALSNKGYTIINEETGEHANIQLSE